MPEIDAPQTAKKLRNKKYNPMHYVSASTIAELIVKMLPNPSAASFFCKKTETKLKDLATNVVADLFADDIFSINSEDGLITISANEHCLMTVKIRKEAENTSVVLDRDSIEKDDMQFSNKCSQTPPDWVLAKVKHRLKVCLENYLDC